jgi:dTDP-4-amino-4,6-dideoxygalactose transaminase
MTREVKLVDIKAQYDEIRDDLWREWEKAFDSMHLMLGPNMSAFEEEFAAYCGAEGAAAVDSGTSALLLALRSMGIGEGDEVLMPSWTFFATPESVILAGAYPVMIDIDETTLNISAEKVRGYIETNCRPEGGRWIDRKTGKNLRAIVPVHIFGLPADMDELTAIAGKYRLLVLEDCAQAHGAEHRGRKVGSIGDCAAFSFYLSKNLSALGEAGIVLSRNREYIERVKRLRVHGQSDRYHHSDIGYNARMDELQAVVLRLKLKRLNEWNRKRNQTARMYDERLRDLPLVLPARVPGSESVYHLYVIRCRERDELAEHLKQRRIGVGIHYPLPCHLQPALSFLGYRAGSLPVTEKMAGEVLTIPMHPHLTTDDIDRVTGSIREFFENR